MNNHRNHLITSVFGIALLASGPVVAGEDSEKKIAQARSAGPAAVSSDATIVVDGEVVVEGSNGWTCMTDLMPGDNAPVCMDHVWSEMVAALGAKKAFTATKVGVSYMLPGDPEGSGVSNSDPYDPNPTEADDYVETGPHLMIILPKSALEGVTDDPTEGGPYVMWKDTDYAHLMVPVK